MLFTWEARNDGAGDAVPRREPVLTTVLAVACVLAVALPAVAVARRSSARAAVGVRGTIDALAAMERAGGRSTEAGGGAHVAIPRRTSDDVWGAE